MRLKVRMRSWNEWKELRGISGGRDHKLDRCLPNYRPDIEAIGRLAQYVLYGGVPRDMPEHEIELAKEVLRNMKTTKKKS
jgi:hypothetical protein